MARRRVVERSLLELLPVQDVDADLIWGPSGQVTLLYDLDVFHEPGLTDRDINELTRKAQGAWNALPEDVVYQFLVLADAARGRSAVETAWPRIEAIDERTRVLEAYRAARIRELLREDRTGKNLSLVLERRHYFAATFRPKAINPTWSDDPAGKLSEMIGLVPHSSLSGHPLATYRQVLAEAAVVHRRVEGGLRQMGLHCRRCDSGDIVSLLYQILNPEASQSRDQRQLSERAIRFRAGTEDPRNGPESREARASAPWAYDYSPLHALVDDDHREELKYVQVGSHYAGIITLKELPNDVEPGAIIPLLSLGRRRFVISYRVQKAARAKKVNELRKKGMLAHAFRLHNYFVETDHKDIHAAEIEQQVEDALRRIYSQGECVFGASLQVLVYEQDPARLDEACSDVLSLMGGSSGLHGKREVPATLEKYLSFIPGAPATAAVCELMTPETVDLMPVFDSAQSKGVVPFRTSRNTCTWIDLFDRSACPNANVLITGTSGTGKSYLANTLLFSYQIAAAAIGFEPPAVSIVDCGGSYDRAMRVLPGGVSRTFTPESLHGADPFQHDPEQDEPLDDHVSALSWLLLDLFGIDERDTERFGKVHGILGEALHTLYSSPLPRNVAGLQTALTARSNDEADSLARSADRFRMGSVARLFRTDPKTALSDEVRSVAYDFEGLKGKPHESGVALRLVVFEIRRRTARLHKKRIRSLVLFDESWMLLNADSGQKKVVDAAGPFLAEYVRTARKLGGGVIALSQQMSDFMQCPWGPAIVSNSATKFIGGAGGETEIMDLKRYLGITDRQAQQISALQEHPREFLLIQGGSSGRTEVIQSTSDPLSLWTFGTAPDERKRMAEVAATYTDRSLFEQIQLLAS